MNGNSNVIVGKVIRVIAKGAGPNSAELQISIQPDLGKPETYVVRSGKEPQVFAAMASLASAAYATSIPIKIESEPSPGQTPEIISIGFPA